MYSVAYVLLRITCSDHLTDSSIHMSFEKIDSMYQEAEYPNAVCAADSKSYTLSGASPPNKSIVPGSVFPPGHVACTVPDLRGATH